MSRGSRLPRIVGAGAVLAAAAPSVAQFRDLGHFLPAETATAAGVSWADFDGDGDLDVFTTTYGRSAGNDANRLLENRGEEGFSLVDAPELELAEFLCTGSAWADFDEDGDPDLFVASESDSGNTLFRNDGAGKFVDVTPDVLRGRYFYAVAWVDYDRDGDLDLSVASRDGSRLFRNVGGGAFVDATRPEIALRAWCLSWRDWDGDGDPDVFLGGIQGEPLVLARNEGGGVFTDAAAGMLGGTTDGAFSGDFADFDRDGDLDLYVTYFSDDARLFRNDGRGFWSEATPDPLRGSGAAYTAMWCDYDSDGAPDVLRAGLVTGGTRLVRNEGGGSFRDVTSLLGPAAAEPAWGAAWADWDQDGRLDLFLGVRGGRDVLLRNEGLPRRWLDVELEGTLSNRDGIGGRIVVEAGGLRLCDEISGGGEGWCSQGPRRARFGLGTETSAKVTVHWPSGQRQIFTETPVDTVLVVRETGLRRTREAVPAQAAFFFDLNAEGARIGAASLHARRALSGDPFTPIPLLFLGGRILRGAVPDSIATEIGMEYFVEFDLGGGTRRTPFDGERSPLFAPGEFSSLAAPAPLPALRHSLVGFPFTAAESTVAALLGDQLGPPDPQRWRVGRWDPALNDYVEAPDTTFVIRPGDAFWVIADRDVNLAAGGTAADVTAGVEMRIEAGWNQVSHPFLFPVALADVDFSRARNVEPRIVGFRDGGYVEEDVLEPWRGYWMHNGSLSAEWVTVPGRPAVPPSARAPGVSEPVLARVTVGAEQGASWDRGNEARMAPGEQVALTGADLLEPPPPPGGLRVWFEAPDAAGVPRALTRDVRGDDRAGHVWELRVASTEPSTVHLVLERDPSGFPALLLLEGTRAAHEIGARLAIPLPGGRTHRFQLAVGAPEFLESVRSGALHPAPAVELRPAWPNPFHVGTRIGFAIPTGGSVRLAVHDVSGRLVRTLVQGPRAAGHHETAWPGTDESGRAVASGVYFVRLDAGETVLTRKVVRAR